MKVSALDKGELADQLAGGLLLRTPPFTFHITARGMPELAARLHLLYADYACASAEPFADFHIALRRPQNIRRWLRGQVRFEFDGQVPFRPLPRGQAAALLEWGMNWCVYNHFHACLIIHAAVVERGGLAAVLPAPPGSGKSTLCAALIQRGWRLLSDELALLDTSSGDLIPFPRPVGLKNGSIGILRDFEPGVIVSTPMHDTHKGSVAHLRPGRSDVDQACRRARPGWIVFPRYAEGSDAQLTPLPRAQAFMDIATNAVNYSLLGRLGFDTLADVVGRSNCYAFSYSRLQDAVDTFEALAATTTGRS